MNDDNNRLIEYNGQAVTYDAEGNMLSANGLVLTYDSANRLISAGNNSYIYDIENTRIKNLCNGVETVYTYNTNANLSQLLVKITEGVVTKYVYGNGLIGEETSGNFKTYHFDYRGSTVAITDISGTVTDTFTYDSYGNLLSRTGTSDVIFLYNGEYGVVTDYNGLLYMRARYYSPELRRFVNADVLLGDINNSATLNRYAYANGNPISNIDPFGLSPDDSRGKTEYDRDDAVKYAKKYHKDYNSKDYVSFDDLIFSIMYFFNYGAWTGMADCANFISQCLVAGGLSMSENWHFYEKINEAVALPGITTIQYKDENGTITSNPITYDFTASWSSANSQYKFFSNKKTGT